VSQHAPKPAVSELPKLLTAADIAELLGNLPTSTVHAWARSGYLPSIKLGRHRRFVRDDVLAFIDAQRDGGGRGDSSKARSAQ
jgi:excisionase family DNA binding protein